MEGKKKSLEQMLLDFTGKPTASNAAKNRKVFMEHWDEIQVEYAKGWSYLIIWKAMTAEGVITFSYPSFTSYIRKMENRQGKAAFKNASQQHQPRVSRAEIGQDIPNPTKSELTVSRENAARRGEKYF